MFTIENTPATELTNQCLLELTLTDDSLSGFPSLVIAGFGKFKNLFLYIS